MNSLDPQFESNHARQLCDGLLYKLSWRPVLPLDEFGRAVDAQTRV
jgi:hypothetical protein